MNASSVLFMTLALLVCLVFGAEVEPITPDFESTLTKKILPEGLRPAIIFDDHVRFGAEAAKGQRDLATIKLEPVAAIVEPIVGDVDDNIINMAYDLSFEPRPNANAVAAKKLNKGAKLLNGIVKMKQALQWAMNNGRESPKEKKGKKVTKKGGKKGGKKGDKKSKKAATF